MIALIAKRLLETLPTLAVLSFLSFMLIRWVPGDPVLLLLGERGASPEAYQEMQAQLGLDQPWLIQYGKFIERLAHGDLGDSILSRRPVLEEFMDRFPATLELSLVAMALAVSLGIPLGVLAAVHCGSLLDSALMGLALTGYSLPIFWWGLLLILLFSVKWSLAPVSGRIAAEFDVPTITGFYLWDVWGRGSEEPWRAFGSALRHLILPAFVLSTIPMAALARMTRATVIEVLGEDYIRTARAKGLSEFRILFIHALKNALIPIVTVGGLMLGTLLTGAVLTESLFAWPGLGSWLVKSVTSRDYPVIQGALLLIALVIVGVNLIVDVLYLWLNPRAKGVP